MKIIDLSAGNRAIWYNKSHPLATYLDRRSEVSPTFICDTTAIPKKVGSGFGLICWDPPHMNCGPKSNMSRCYGYHTTETILDTIRGTESEAHRIASPDALMAFKWNTHDIGLNRILRLMPHWEPLFGHLTKSGPHSQTYWVMLRRLDRPVWNSEFNLEAP